MKDYIKERAVAIANYIVDYNATVRQTAKRFWDFEINGTYGGNKLER